MSDTRDLAALTEAEFWPLVEQAKERVLTNDLDALERLIVDGLPADEMQAAAWALVQRVRGLHSDLRWLEQARARWAAAARGGDATGKVWGPERMRHDPARGGDA
jgi:hypothetical protein